ncbi:MAG: pyridoxamine 5'-phosphate oxidase family protein [Bacteroidota bacterium]
MLGKLNKIQIDNLLRSQAIGRIGCSADSTTYVVPITYAYDGTNIYAHTIEGMKVRMMRANPKVCFEVDHIENMANWQSVIAWGTYVELDNKEAEEALQILVNRVHPLMTSETTRPVHSMERKSTSLKTNMRMVVFRIEVKEVSGRFEKG